MVTLDLESLNIEEFAALRDSVIEKLAEKVIARQAELESELEPVRQQTRQEGSICAGREAEEGQHRERARRAGGLTSKAGFSSGRPGL